MAAVALRFPDAFVAGKSALLPGLMIIMLSMGLTLRWANFATVFKHSSAALVLGVALQYLVMPLAAFVTSRLLGLNPQDTAGMVLVGSTAGGTASNVMTYMAGGHVALSIAMTSLSTLVAVVAMPFLTWFYIGQKIDVPVMQMLVSLAQIILLPVLLGMTLNTMFENSLQRIKPALPLVSMLTIVLVIAVIVALNEQRIAAMGAGVFAAVALHNTVGLASGFWVSKWLLKCDASTSRTLAIEVGMQNSGLAAAIAAKYFSAAAALPGAIFSIWHNLSGSALAAWWRQQSRREATRRFHT